MMRSKANVAVIILLLLAVCVFPAAPASAQAPQVSGDPAIGVTYYHEVILVQGENPQTEEVEHEHDVWVLDRTAWSVPWNSSTVYIWVPDGARNVTIEHWEQNTLSTTTDYVRGRFHQFYHPLDADMVKVVTQGPYAGFHSWSFPDGADRNFSAALSVQNRSQFHQQTGESVNLSHWNLTGGMLRLEPGVNASTFTSNTTEAGYDISAVTPSWEMNATGNYTIFVSADNGTTWKNATNGTRLLFPGIGNQLRWRVEMEQNVSTNDTPILDGIELDIEYVTEYMDVFLFTSYVLHIDDGSLEFDMYYPFDGSNTGMVFLGYVDPDYTLVSTGVNLIVSQQEGYEGKVVYRHMAADYQPYITLNITHTPDDTVSGGFSNLPLFLLVGIILIAASIFIGLKYSRSQQSKGKPKSAARKKSDADDDRELLEKKKARLERKLADLDEEVELGLIDAEAADELREDYRDKLDDIEEKLAEPEAPEIDEQAISALEARKKKILQAIKRVDGELEDGLIDEDEHGRMRAGYKKKAVEIMKELDELKGK